MIEASGPWVVVTMFTPAERGDETRGEAVVTVRIPKHDTQASAQALAQQRRKNHAANAARYPGDPLWAGSVFKVYVRRAGLPGELW